MAATGAHAVDGGNFQLFQAMVERSNATLHLNVSIHHIRRDPSNQQWLVESEASSEAYDAVILALPLSQTNLTISGTTHLRLPPTDAFVQLHITLFTCNDYNPAIFGPDPPNFIGTSAGPLFRSMNVVGRTLTGQRIVKVFSDQYVCLPFVVSRDGLMMSS